MIRGTCIAMKQEISAKTNPNPNPKQGIMQDLTMRDQKECF
jgi:hypothetical protein